MIVSMKKTKKEAKDEVHERSFLDLRFSGQSV
jgi:hypothetical protein